jgi:hypothetical protein
MAGATAAENCSTCHCQNVIARSMMGGTVSNRKRLPDPETCRTIHLEQFPELSKCLVEDPDACKYAVRIGSGVYCYNPHRFRFEKTLEPPLKGRSTW